MSGVRTTGDISKVVSKLKALDRKLDPSVHEQVDDEAKSLVSSIDEQIIAKGLRGDPEDKPDQDPLLGSFQSDRRTLDKWTISTDPELNVPHAAALEHGTRGRSPEIAATNKQTLKFKDQNGNTIYPKKIPTSGYVLPSTGESFEGSDGHPGNYPYNYVRDAKSSWWPGASRKIDLSVKAAIIESQFKPDIR
jgi:hypothetical protein